MTGTLMGRPQVFERGDKVYLTTPLTLATPSTQQVDEYAFASAVKSQAPNEHIGWLQGRYVEAGKANLNNAMWLSDELALKKLTPMLMPVTVMHDPRTAVGTIADCKLIAEDRSRIDTVLAIWKHRFGDVWEEAEANIKDGTMMQSMECLSPWYTCSECGQSYVKLHEGKEQASWCDHLRSSQAKRILGDVCFTGTGLIFGTRGGQGAYTEAHLDHFQDEIAEFHEKAHIDGKHSPREESPKMGMVQIDEADLATLRSDRDKARDELAEVKRDLTAKAEQAEGDATREKERADKAEKEKSDLQESAQRAQLKSSRWDALGTGFVAKLGEVTKAGLQESASTLSDEDWNKRLIEIEEMSGLKRDATADAAAAAKDGKDGKDDGKETDTASAFNAESFTPEELAKFGSSGVASPSRPASSGTAARSLARALKPSRPKAEATK